MTDQRSHALVRASSAVFAATILFLPWMMGELISFMTQLITRIPELIHRLGICGR
ncbi:MAG: hypothetical protein U0361_03510 [Nitrospiraceae bacterium]